MNDPTQFEQVDETCEFGGAVLYSESLGITAFFENAVPSKYETQKLKQLQFGIENEKIRQFEHECLIRLFQWSFLPPGKALDFSVCDEAFGCYKTQYRKRYLLEICQNASFLPTHDIIMIIRTSPSAWETKFGFIISIGSILQQAGAGTAARNIPCPSWA